MLLLKFIYSDLLKLVSLYFFACIVRFLLTIKIFIHSCLTLQRDIVMFV